MRVIKYCRWFAAFVPRSPPHHLRVLARLDGVEVDAVTVAMLATHEQDGLYTAVIAGGNLPHLSDRRGELLALRRAGGAVVEVAVHVRDPVRHRDPDLWITFTLYGTDRWESMAAHDPVPTLRETRPNI